ncbi:MAG: AAA family ATPase, partial [Actinomycetota bacterium]
MSLWGRENEFELLRGLAAACQRGATGKIAIVTGPPGIGKTALVQALARWSTDQGIPVHDSPDPARGGLLVLEDLHQASPAELAAIAQLTGAIARQPVQPVQPFLVVLTARPVPRRSDVDALLARLTREQGATWIELAPLEAATGTGPALLVRAGGNPQLLAILTAPAPGGDPAGGDPAGTDAAIARWLSFLPLEIRDLLAIASVLQPDCSLGELAALSGTPVGQLVPAVMEALAAGVLAERGSRLGFAHPAVQEALYRQLPAPVRSGLHREASRLLAEAGSLPERVAHHALA